MLVLTAILVRLYPDFNTHAFFSIFFGQEGHRSLRSEYGCTPMSKSLGMLTMVPGITRRVVPAQVQFCPVVKIENSS